MTAKADHNRQKKIALINDYTGFGRCSVTVQLPLISALRVQCCPLPTAVLSDHTGFPSYFCRDCTDDMQVYADEWEKLGLRFDGICTGFMGSARQIQIVLDFIDRFGGSGTTVVVDPVMGDYGRTYPTYTPELCREMGKLVPLADIVTPNLTEACILTGCEYHDGHWTMREIRRLSSLLHEMGPEKVVITGIPQGGFVANYCSQKDGQKGLIRTHKVGTSRSGTGDAFCAIVAADAVNGVDFRISVRKASRFIKKCIIRSIELGLPLTDGVCFEELLTTLK